MSNKKNFKYKNTSGKTKPFPVGVTLMLILLLSCLAVAACIALGFVIDALISVIAEGSGADRLAISVVITAVLATVLLVLLFVLIRHRSTEKKNRPTRSHTDVVLIVLIFLAVGAAVTLFALGDNNRNINFLVAIALFPAVGIITTPNAVSYALKDMKKWKKIFSGNGNLHQCKEDENFYKVKTPVSFERKLFWAIFKNQVLDHATVIFLMFLIVNAGIARMVMGEHQAQPGLIGAIVHVRIERATGFLFFALIIIAAVGIPILAYYVTNAVCRLKVVKKHQYIAYHAVVKSVRSYKMSINDDGRHYRYNYATCVGIREKNVHDTKATLIFIPDDVLVFPDKGQ